MGHHLRIVDDHQRRPLLSRQQSWAKQLALMLASSPITPNQISAFSIVFSLLGMCFLWLSAEANAWLYIGLMWLAALCCQLRLICNLMDGMVAIEGKQQSADGVLWNEFPDRVSDIAFFVGAGLATNEFGLSWAVAALAITTAYVRELGKGIDGVVDFSGPMAKPHRMALLSLAFMLAGSVELILLMFVGSFNPSSIVIGGLWICAVGCALTIFRRVMHIRHRLMS